MRKFKNITLSILLIAVIAVGLSASFCAAVERSGYVYFDRGDIYRVSDNDFEIPYLYASATYKGHGLYYQFRTKMTVTFNGVTRPTAYGSPSWSSSTASEIISPCMPDDTYSWTHGYEDVK